MRPKAAAAKLGYPVILKAMVPNIAHRSDAGLVSGKISDDAELRQEFADAASQCSRFGRKQRHRQRRKIYAA